MKYFSKFLYLLAAVAINPLPAFSQNLETEDETIALGDYIFLKSVGQVGRLEADKECLDRGLRLVSTQYCDLPSSIFQCLADMGAPLEIVAKEIEKSAIWQQVPWDGEDGEQIKGFWFGKDFGFLVGDSQEEMYIRFAHFQSEDEEDPSLRIYEVEKNQEKHKLSVICQR